MKSRVSGSANLISAALFTGMVLSGAWCQNSAVSSHFNFGENITGVITLIQVRVPSDGLAFSTYYETLGFWGNKGNSTGNGYGGIQKSTDPRGSEIHIFSIWHALDNPADTANFPYAVHLGHGTVAEYFGGEGVGLKTWNFELGWQTDVWHTHVVRCWDAGSDTYYGFFARSGTDSIWRHLSTIGVREPSIRIQGANDAFLEDWSSTGDVPRTTHLRYIWRRDTQGTWTPARSGRYSPNAWDLDPGKRSYNYRTNWDAGTASDETGDYYYMVAGGSATAPTPPLSYPDNMSHTYSLDVSGTAPDFKAGAVEALNTAAVSDRELEVTWSIDSAGLPQFAYAISVFESGQTNELLSTQSTVPQARKDTLDISSLDLENKSYRVVFTLADLFDQESTRETFIGNGAAVSMNAPVSPDYNMSWIRYGRELRFQNLSAEILISLKDLSGRCLMARSIPAFADISLHFPSLGPGLYLIRIQEKSSMEKSASRSISVFYRL